MHMRTYVRTHARMHACLSQVFVVLCRTVLYCIVLYCIILMCCTGKLMCIHFMRFLRGTFGTASALFQCAGLDAGTCTSPRPQRISGNCASRSERKLQTTLGWLQPFELWCAVTAWSAEVGIGQVVKCSFARLFCISCGCQTAYLRAPAAEAAS